MNFSKSTFWDIDQNTLDYVTHADFIIRRVFDQGRLSDFKEVIKHYDSNTIIRSLKTAPHLDKKTLSFVSTYFDLPLEEFKCYSKIQLARNASGF